MPLGVRETGGKPCWQIKKEGKRRCCPVTILGGKRKQVLSDKQKGEEQL
jgi:hypothetical protein